MNRIAETTPGADEALRWVLPALLALTVGAYLNSFSGSWQFDDFAVLLRDARVQSLASWWQSLPHIRPLFKLSVAFNHQLMPGLIGFHTVNLLLHALNVLMVYVLFLRLLRQHGTGPRAPFAAFLIAAVFASHPAQTEVVTYLSGRSVALETAGVLLACFGMMLARERVQRRWYVVAGFGLLLAVGARETAIVLPLFWLLLAWSAGAAAPPSMLVPTDNRTVARSPSISVRRLLLVFALMLAILLGLLGLPRYRSLLWQALQWPDLGQLLAAQTQALQHLLLVALVAVKVNPDPALQVQPLNSIGGLVALLVVVAIVALAWFMRRRRRLLTIGLAWAAIAWLPSHTLLLRFDPVNDRQLYLALPGLLLALVALVPDRLWYRRQVWLLLLLPLLLLPLTWRQNAIYHNEIRFWQAVVTAAPHNARGWNNLGVAYAADGLLVQGEQAFLTALQARPDYVRAAVNLKLLRAGRPLHRQ